MSNANGESLKPLQVTDFVDQVLHDAEIASFVARNVSVERRTREAAEWLVKENPNATPDEIVKAVRRVLQPLLDGRLRVFFSYKARDREIATRIAGWLEDWSARKLEMEHMARFGFDQVGLDWRKKIEETIPKCDWFLLLLPSPGEEGNEKDWVLFEAGYFKRGQGLSGRFVCLHHPENEVADVLDKDHSVPAQTAAVEDFLKALFHLPNWVPGMPPINSALSDLRIKAQSIVDMIRGQASPGVRFCCGPHMQVTFEDASAVRGWEELARGRVIDSNEDCKRLFGLQVPKSSFGDWVADVEGADRDEGWVKELAKAVQAAGEGRQVPAIRATFLVGDGRRMRPTVCAVRRRRSDQRAEAVDILFSGAELPHDTSSMKPELAALAVTLQFAVRFRYQVLESYVGRKIERKDGMAFYRAMNDLRLEAARDPRFAGDPSLIRKETLASFIGEDKTVVQKMYERWDQLWRPDGKGEMDQAIEENKGEALEGFVKELIDMIQRFLSVTSKRFAELIARP